MEYKHLFGPVPSRRLGLSLGVDLVPMKTCSLNCVYCECGRTTNLTIERKAYVNTNKVIEELKDYLTKSPEIDYITFSGSGEPTLCSGIGKIISFIKNNFSQYKLALLTNSTLLNDPTVQQDILNVDVILPSLDAVSEDIFKKINRPCNEIKSKDIINGLINFRNIFKGKILLEVFILPGINDHDEEIKLFKESLSLIKPDLIQLNSLDRPGTESWVTKSKEENLIKIKEYFDPLPVEIIAKFKKGTKITFEQENIENKILSVLYRRPCTLEDLTNTTGLNIHEINKYLIRLIEINSIEYSLEDRGKFYKIKK